MELDAFYKKRIIIILFCASVILIGIFSILIWLGPAKPVVNRVCLKQDCFSVELAKSEEQRARGLMFREHLAGKEGMLFIFEKEDIYSFWMKNTLIPLDIIWLNKEGRAVFIKKNAQPCSLEICPGIVPDATALYVLEINAGKAEEIGLKIGEQLEIKIRGE